MTSLFHPSVVNTSLSCEEICAKCSIVKVSNAIIQSVAVFDHDVDYLEDYIVGCDYIASLILSPITTPNPNPNHGSVPVATSKPPRSSNISSSGDKADVIDLVSDSDCESDC